MSTVRDYDLADSHCDSVAINVCLQISTHWAGSASIPFTKPCYMSYKTIMAFENNTEKQPVPFVDRFPTLCLA